MTDTKLIASIFNGFMSMYKGEKSIGLKQLYESYEEHPVFLALVAHLDKAQGLPVTEVLHEIYGFYKKYRMVELTDEDWEAIVEETRKIAAKRENNPWCNGIILAMMNLLEADDKERRKMADEIAKEMEAAMQEKEDAA